MGRQHSLLIDIDWSIIYAGSSATKLKRRRWDPPKQRQLAKSLSSDSEADFNDGAGDGSEKSRAADSERFDATPSQLERSLQDVDPSRYASSHSSAHRADAETKRGAPKNGVRTSDCNSIAAPSHEPSFWDFRGRDFINLRFPSLGPSDEAVGTAGSPTSDERMASQALASLAQGVGLSVLAPPRPPSIDSVLERAMQLTSLRYAHRPYWIFRVIIKILQLFRRGLPPTTTAREWGGAGSSEPCSVCTPAGRYSKLGPAHCADRGGRRSVAFASVYGRGRR